MRRPNRSPWCFLLSGTLSLIACGDSDTPPGHLVDAASDTSAVVDVPATDTPDAGLDASNPPGDSSLACTAGQVACGTYCADTARDPLNCGGCGMACMGGASCTSGRCGSPMTGDGGMVGPDGALTCGAGQVNCGAYCADTARDPLNCGACGMRCMTQPCNAGRCGATGGGDGGGGGRGDGGGGGGDGGTVEDVGVPCGRPGAMCCATEPRCLGSACAGGMCPSTTTCGMSGQPCCAGSMTCAPGLTCSAGTCR